MMSRLASLASTLDRNHPRVASLSRAARTTVLGVLGAAVTVAWAGCGSEAGARYYCDSTGCFDCDAYGCSSVAPPAHKNCTGTTSCDPGSVCTATGCTQVCSDSVPCAKGEVCKAGLCAAPTADPGARKECETRSDCPQGTCVAGACETCGGTAGPCRCEATSDCATDQACVGGLCTAPTNSCTFSSECESRKVCADGQCLARCETTPCADGFHCDKGACHPSGGAGCTTNEQCGADTPRCVAGSCAKACSADVQCGGGFFCDQGACIVDTRPKPNCTSDDQCGGTSATPKRCLGGFCKFTCTTAQGDAYCRTIDNRIGSCAKDLVCRSAAEANAECLVATDCGNGKDCIDNQCR